MLDHSSDATLAQQARWLKQYYFLRAAVSIIWVALAFSVGRQSPMAMAVLLIVYPAWDALANFIDLSRSGGSASNPSQTINAVISGVTTIAVVLALQADPSWVLDVFGAWAILSGLLQLNTAVRRWKRFGAQWSMILSGAQSAVAGALFIAQAHAPTPAIVKVAGYAAVGALYFLVSAVWLSVSDMRRRQASAS